MNFLSVNAFDTEDDFILILSRIHVSNGMTVEEIQNQVEVSLMAEKYFAVAKSYMLYRQKHTETREIRDNMNFLMDYCNVQNAATGSKFETGLLLMRRVGFVFIIKFCTFAAAYGKGIHFGEQR